MDYNLLINEYLDGTLSAQQESQLFMALSTNEELRTELKQAIALDKGLSKRVTAFVPSSASTMNIFTQLGIGTAVGAATTAAAIGLKPTFLAFLSTYSQAIITGAIAVAMTAGSFLAFYNPVDKQSANLSNYSNQYKYSGNGPESINKLIPMVKSESREETNSSVRVDTIIRYVDRIIEREDLDSQIETDEISSPDSEKFVLLNESIPARNTIKDDSQFRFSQEIASDMNTYSPMANDISLNRPLNISFEVKGNGYWSIPKPDVPQYSTPAFANIQLSALYRFSEKFKAGIDFRQESFYQKFEGTNEIGESFEYKQYPAYYTLAIMGRYNFWQNNIYSTFAQASIGGTATGLVSRMMFGFELSPMSNLSFVLGLEGSMLSYIHQNNLFNSPKIGLNYGVAFNF